MCTAADGSLCCFRFWLHSIRLSLGNRESGSHCCCLQPCGCAVLPLCRASPHHPSMWKAMGRGGGMSQGPGSRRLPESCQGHLLSYLPSSLTNPSVIWPGSTYFFRAITLAVSSVLPWVMGFCERFLGSCAPQTKSWMLHANQMISYWYVSYKRDISPNLHPLKETHVFHR